MSHNSAKTVKAMDSLTTSSTARILTTLTQFPTRHDHRPRRGCLVLRPSRTLRRAPTIVCMAVSTKNPRKIFVLFLFFHLGFIYFGEIQEPYLITKLESAEKTWKDLSVCLKSFEWIVSLLMCISVCVCVSRSVIYIYWISCCLYL